jgi:hypothetical protein
MFKFFFSKLKNLIRNEKEKFILVKNKLSRNREMPFDDIVYYILVNKGKSTVLELDDYYYEKYGVDKLPISKQALSKQRQYLNPSIFTKANLESIKDIYSNDIYDLKNFKGYIVLGIDGCQVNVPNTPITKEELEVDLRALKESESPKARISVLSDLKNDFVIDSILSPFKIGEQKLAFEHIENAKETIDLKRTITIYDRGYASTELIMQLEENNSKFIFRLKESHFKKERKKMKSDDEYVDINLNHNRTANIKNQNLKETAKETDYLNLRIVNIEIKPGVIETLLTNIPHKIASQEELKELYGERWEIETNYNTIKNKIHIENFSGKKLIIIEQDFYSQMLVYNMLIGLKIECNKKIKESKKYENCEYEYKQNINLLAGKLKTNAIRMIFAENEDEIEKIENRIYNSAKRYLRKVTEKPSTKRNKKPKRKYPYNNRKNF